MAALACHLNSLGLFCPRAICNHTNHQLLRSTCKFMSGVWIENIGYHRRRLDVLGEKHRFVVNHIAYRASAHVVVATNRLNTRDGTLVGHLGKLDNRPPRFIFVFPNGTQLIDTAK